MAAVVDPEAAMADPEEAEEVGAAVLKLFQVQIQNGHQQSEA
jgi:hypothetical protein